MCALRGNWSRCYQPAFNQNRLIKTAVAMNANLQPTYDPLVQWNPDVEEYLKSILGTERFQSICSAISRPPGFTTIRVNTTKTTAEDVLARLPDALAAPLQTSPYIHPQIPQAIIIPILGPYNDINYDEAAGKEVIVGRMAAEAMLKGAMLYSPGVLAASSGIEYGDIVAVSIGIEVDNNGSYGVPRGATIEQNLPIDDPRFPQRHRLFIGLARATLSRTQFFSQAQGQALEMISSVYTSPSLNGVLKGELMLQSLPSLAAALVLNPTPGSRVLDMCASPGGKTTALAEIMGNKGEVIAIDRSHTKAAAVEQLAADLYGEKSCITAMKADSRAILLDFGSDSLSTNTNTSTTIEEQDNKTTIIDSGRLREERKEARRKQLGLPSQQGLKKKTSRVQTCPGFPPESFDYILLDAPCSALGLRPRLILPQTMNDLLKNAQYQRGLLDVAIKLLKPGGSMVFSTCTINPLENENNVAYALRKYSHCIRLVDQQPRLVSTTTGLAGPIGAALHDPDFKDKPGLTEEEASLVQRFDPGGELDTPGFFIAKFTKFASC